jgi:hypothetical protein
LPRELLRHTKRGSFTVIDLETWEQIEGYLLVAGVGGLIAYMGFIVWRLAAESKAGRIGYIVLFLALGLGVLGFIIKAVLVHMLK